MMSAKFCLQIVFLFELASFIFATTTTQLNLHETKPSPRPLKSMKMLENRLNEVKDNWKKKVMVQASAIFRGMETFLNRVFNNTKDEDQRYQEFIARVLYATGKVTDALTKVLKNDAQLHKKDKPLKLKVQALSHKGDPLIFPKDYHNVGVVSAAPDAYYDDDRYYQ